MSDAVQGAARTAGGEPGIWRRLRALSRKDRGAVVGALVIAVFLFAGIFAPLIAPYDPLAQDISRGFEGFSARHWLGTDEYGRDLLSRIIHGARPALLIGVLSVCVSMSIGVPIGMLAGYCLGPIDRIVGVAVDIMLALPSLLLALMIVALLGASTGALVLAIGIAHVPIFIRLARGSTLVVRSLDYVSQSRALGSSTPYILLRHVLPNISGPLIIMASLSIAGAIREEASLSFLGVGVQPPYPSWGNLIRDGVVNVLEAPHLAVLPGAVLTLAVLAFNLVGDAMRDMLDPREESSAGALTRRRR